MDLRDGGDTNTAGVIDALGDRRGARAEARPDGRAAADEVRRQGPQTRSADGVATGGRNRGSQPEVADGVRRRALSIRHPLHDGVRMSSGVNLAARMRGPKTSSASY